MSRHRLSWEISRKTKRIPQIIEGNIGLLWVVQLFGFLGLYLFSAIYLVTGTIPNL